MLKLRFANFKNAKNRDTDSVISVISAENAEGDDSSVGAVFSWKIRFRQVNETSILNTRFRVNIISLC